MTIDDIKEIINEEIKSEANIKNVFGLDLTKCLVTPTKQVYLDFNKSHSENLWTVLEETPDTNGYKIYFDEKTSMFGLGIKSDNDELINIGYYGTFLQTLYSM